MSTVDEVKQRIDIVEVVSRYTQLQKSGRNFKALCPFHSEKTPSFYVFPDRQSWHCFGACATGGDALSFVMKKEGMTFGEALRFLADRAGVLIPTRIEPAPQRGAEERLYQANEVACQFFHNSLVATQQAENVRAYLTRRGLNAKSISDFQIGYAPDSWEGVKQHLLQRGFNEKEILASGLAVQSDEGRTYDRFRHRLMFPIRDQRGRVTGFGGRALSDDVQPKYLNSPQTPIFDKSDTLYGIDMAAAAIRREDLAVIVEGYMDVIIPHQYGFSNVVASMGVAITDRQVDKLKKLTRNLVLALDPDRAGEEAMLRCLDYEGSLGAEIRMLVVPDGKDPDELIIENPDSWRELVARARPVLEFTIEKTASRLDMTTARGKSAAASALVPVIARVRDDIRRDHYLDRLSRLSGIAYNRLEAVLKNHLARPKVEGPAAVHAVPAVRPVTNAREDYCLALLLKFPELKTQAVGLLPDYFQDSENREIFKSWLETDDVVSLKERLDPVVKDKVGQLEARALADNRIPEKYDDCVLLMRKDYLQAQEAMRKEIFAMEAETAGHKAALVRLEKEGMEPSVKLSQAEKERARARRRRK